MFHNARLPDNIERGATSSPTYNTTVNRLTSGFEQRNQNWETPLSTYDIGYSIRSIEDIDIVRDFFHAREGRTHSFRFKDWLDYTTRTTQQPTRLAGTDTTLYLERRYTDGTFNKDVTIIRPISSALQIFRDGVSYTQWTYDETTGQITVQAAGTYTWTGEYDKEVRFAEDSLSISIELFNLGTVPSIELQEIRSV